MKRITDKIAQWFKGSEKSDEGVFQYRKIWLFIVLSTSLVSLAPLVIMFFINYFQYRNAIDKEIKHPLELTSSTIRRSLKFFLEERESALNFIIHDVSYEQLRNQKRLTEIFHNLQRTFKGFVDIGLIDADGKQRSYVGPYGLRNKDYKKQEWFVKALFQGRFVSDVFMGYRKYPHFSIAVKNENDEGKPYILRVSLNASIFEELGYREKQRKTRDAFIINHEGFLQTPSIIFGDILNRVPIQIPPYVNEARVIEQKDSSGIINLIGYSYIEDSPFIFIVFVRKEQMLSTWLSLRGELIGFLAVSMALIVLVILTGATFMVRRLNEADVKRIKILHNVEYTSKMASIGRLAAGVAHEINNPLAVINEKSGLLKDYVEFTDNFPEKDKFLKHINPIFQSVERCSRITRRLLRFAKQMDLNSEPIKLEHLLREVLGFVDKEAAYRRVSLQFDVEPNFPLINSDPGRLQQVFLNIINNALAAIKDGGRIAFKLWKKNEDYVNISIIDNGEGIPEENINNVFEPFFTTKGKYGTGLGLSITYGIVKKLGGDIEVASKIGEGSKFTITLPIKPKSTEGADGQSKDFAG